MRDRYCKNERNYLTAGLSILIESERIELSGITEEVSIGALCIGAAEESVVASSDVELSVHDAMIDVMATIAKNFFI